MTQWSCRTKWCKPQDGSPKSDQSEWRQWNMRTGGWFTLLILQLVNWGWSYSNGPTMTEIQRTLVGQQPLFSPQHLPPWYFIITLTSEGLGWRLATNELKQHPLTPPIHHHWKGNSPTVGRCLQDILESRTRQQQQHDHNEWKLQTTWKERIATEIHHIIKRGSIQHM